MKNMPRMVGTYSRQAHADFPKNTYERELGRNGFFGLCTHMHHTHAPTAWTHWEGPLKPRAFDLTQLAPMPASPYESPIVLQNAFASVRFWHTKESMSHLVRNGDGDDALFVHKGQAHLFCDYGHMHICEGDYVILPRGTMWRMERHEDAFQALIIEATNDSYTLPDKGMLGPHAIFDPAMLDTPDINDRFKAQQEEKETLLVIKRHNAFSKVTFPYNPLDAVGWHGTLMPVRINVSDIRPIMSHRYHLPPSAHTTFVAKRFVICTFAPRPIESDPGALKVPFYHNNDDFDEFLFYHKGEFFSRDNIHPGMTTFHPSGFTHGPHPGAFKAGKNFAIKETNEVAVMIDFRDAAHPGEFMENIEWKDYLYSWKSNMHP